jgi:hypothetical protein
MMLLSQGYNVAKEFIVYNNKEDKRKWSLPENKFWQVYIHFEGKITEIEYYFEGLISRRSLVRR